MAVDNLVFTDEYYFPNWICSRHQTGEDRVNVDDSSHCDFIFHCCECRRRRRQLHLLLQIRRHKIWFVNKMLDSWCHNKVYDPALNGCNNFFSASRCSPLRWNWKQFIFIFFISSKSTWLLNNSEVAAQWSCRQPRLLEVGSSNPARYWPSRFFVYT